MTDKGSDAVVQDLSIHTDVSTAMKIYDGSPAIPLGRESRGMIVWKQFIEAMLARWHSNVHPVRKVSHIVYISMNQHAFQS